MSFLQSSTASRSQAKYRRLRNHLPRSFSQHEPHKLRRLSWFFPLLIFIFLLAVLRRHSSADSSKGCDSVDGYICNPSISHYWGQYSPYFSVPSEVSADVPTQCEVTFAQVLSRHGARDPTEHKSQAYKNFIEQVKGRTISFEDEFAFLEDYNYTLGEDQLTQFGRQQLNYSGQQFYSRYRSLVQKGPPFIRASGQQRVIESAEEWVAGLSMALGAENGDTSDGADRYPIIIIPEGEGKNNTLDNGLCTKFVESYGRLGDEAMAGWIDTFIPSVRRRVNQHLKGAELSKLETVYLMDLCPFETVANQDGRLSDFCELFTEDEWKAYDYLQSLDKYYGYGDGNPLGPTQGVGFVNELIARLSSSAVHDDTSSNSTLDGDPESFPIGPEHPLFADFSHDNDMVGIFSALNLFVDTEPMSNTTLRTPEQMQGFAASWVVPFAARLYVEKLQCGQDEEERVRLILNDRVMPLHGCVNDEYRMCGLEDFLNSLDFARSGGRWDECFT